MSQLIDFLYQHSFWTAVALYWIFSAAVSAMPDPMPGGSPGYLWLYRFLHTIAGNLSTVAASKIPGIAAVKVLTLIVLLPLLSLQSCAAGHYIVHPGSVSTIDSQAYDALLVAQATIDQARLSPLPESIKPALNKAVLAYNVARDSWLTYRGALATKADPAVYLAQLNKNLSELSDAIAAFKGAK
jgi:hypothetical protein